MAKSYQIFVFFLFAFVFSVALGDGETPPQGYNVYNKSDECQKACVGEHDLNCVLAASIDNNEYYVCRCSSMYYSRLDFCEIECEERQFWSLFTYGSCDEYTSKVLPGACNKQCVFRVRVWTTVFIIILFVAAVIVVVAMLPMSIVTCVSCFRVSKQHRHIEDLQIVSSEMSGVSSGGKNGAAPASWQYPYYAGYSPYGGRA